MRRLFSIALFTVVCACVNGADEPGPATIPEAELERLEALGYVDFSAKPAEDSKRGVIVRDPERSWPGYNLCTMPALRRAELLDAQGEVVRSFSSDVPGRWERAVLAHDGDLFVMAVEESRRVLLRLRPDGTRRWSSRLPVHHHVTEAPDGRIEVLTRRRRVLPALSAETEFLDNGVALLSAEGELLEERSLYDMLAGRPDLFSFQNVDGSSGEVDPDFLHANFLAWMRDVPLEERSGLYDASNVVVTIRNQDTVAIFDGARGRLLWAWGQGELLRPHDAAILANGNLLIFDNRPGDGGSRVVELDPRTRRIEWEYRAEPPEDFYSATRGTAQRLANGNTLIGESNGGRAFEVTPDGTVVWDFLVPHLNKRGHPAAFRIERYETGRVEVPH